MKKQGYKTLRLVSALNRKKTDPSKYVFTGESGTEGIDIQLFQYQKEKCIESKNILPKNIPAFDENGDNYWLNIYGLSDTASIASICEKQGIHSLVIQAILDVNQRPKYQDYEKHSFLTVKSITPSENALVTEQISFVFNSHCLLSFQERKADFFDHLRNRIRENKGIVRERTPDYLLYAMLESILENYFATLNTIDQEIAQLNFTDLKKEILPNTLEIIENQKKVVNFIKKSILPIKEFTQIVERLECQYIEQRHIKYFLEIKDLCLTLIDSCDIILASLESSTNLFFSMQGHKMNQIMKILTIVSTIFIPLTFIAGIYGMNFSNMPELHWKYGYFGILMLMLLLFTGMMLYFKKKKWF